MQEAVCSEKLPSPQITLSPGRNHLPAGEGKYEHSMMNNEKGLVGHYYQGGLGDSGRKEEHDAS